MFVTLGINIGFGRFIHIGFDAEPHTTLDP